MNQQPSDHGFSCSVCNESLADDEAGRFTGPDGVYCQSCYMQAISYEDDGQAYDAYICPDCGESQTQAVWDEIGECVTCMNKGYVEPGSFRFENGFVDDALYYAEGQQRYDAALGVGFRDMADDLAGQYNLAHQKELSGFTLDEFRAAYDEAHAMNRERG